MALRPTVYKFSISLSDMDRQRYETKELTVAKHPSETDERMMIRVLAWCLNADDQLRFGKGISDADEPDLWLHGLDGQLLRWIDVGEPSFERIRKASRQARDTLVYSFNTKSDVWWRQLAERGELPGVTIYQVRWEDAQALARLVERTVSMSVSISDGAAFVAAGLGECEVSPRVLLIP